MLEAGWAAAEWAFGPACAAHPRRHVVARRGRGKMGWQHGRLIGQDAMAPWWAVARWSWCGRVRDAGTMRGRWRGSVVAERGLHALLGGGSHCQMVRTGFWRQIGSETLRGYEDVSLRTAGPLDRAGCGPKHLPFMGGSLEGEGKRRADGPLPPLTSELGGRFFCGWADGDSAWCPKGGNTADSPSNPGQYGGLVCPIRAIWDMTGRADGGGVNQRTRAVVSWFDLGGWRASTMHTWGEMGNLCIG